MTRAREETGGRRVRAGDGTVEGVGREGCSACGQWCEDTREGPRTLWYKNFKQRGGHAPAAACVGKDHRGVSGPLAKGQSWRLLIRFKLFKLIQRKIFEKALVARES